ncbi:uncharacterized protein LOC112520401 [Cynara cardunculus var. scolymus]|uniref:uncharacterized protein LOC112520401 n=1 Tax=Cynara cardunculus var. scolymus TaxID=59895 RepID=UPI000D62D52E|nr:uncharacterized protein LOC112520401 [Cynara cardunculus var. scolymus]
MEDYLSSMITDTDKKKPERKVEHLVGTVFSWSLSDMHNRNLYKDKEPEIPKTFSSVSEYTKSFVYPIIEETHADLLSKVLGLNHCPTAKIIKVQKSKGFKLPKRLSYTIVLTRREGCYVPVVGDLIALTDVRPKSVEDLQRPHKSYLIAFVERIKIRNSKYELSVLSSKPIYQQEVEDDIGKDSTSYRVEDVKHFAVCLTNLTTNVRIWHALHMEMQADELKMIKKVLRVDFPVEEGCARCSATTADLTSMEMREALNSFQLDGSQEAAVLSCLAARKCRHQNTIKLIWGPPGTGKTKTVGSLLCMLLRMKCRTLTCAPTNIAVVGVTKRFMSLLRDSLPHNVYGLGDVVLFGNRERMKIDDCVDLQDIFLNDRVKILVDCLAPFSGWKGISEWMICFLEDPEVQYQLYRKKHLEGDERESEDKDDEEEDLADPSRVKEAMKKMNWKTLIKSTLKGEKRPINGEISTKTANELPSKQKTDKTKLPDYIMTYEQFVTKGFNFLENRLASCIENLCMHMPTRVISMGAVERMIGLVRSMKRFGQLLKQTVDANVKLRKAMNGFDDFRTGGMSNLYAHRMSILKSLKYLQKALLFPDIKGGSYKRFCLENACLIFCTSSSSTNLHREVKEPLEFLIIDEAAQLKECESLIPLQLRGLRHAILVGDEKQLPAMVQSKICEEAEFGRSLFERLASLGHKKHLLNVQYRMHPSISQFPNREFYDNQVLDGGNVKSNLYGKCFLRGGMYGSYSFINVTSGKEEFDRSQSRKNLMEVAIAAEIIASLFKESVARKRRVSVGCISPYKAQVTAIQEKLGNKYKGSENFFTVNVRSVDGFQGSEEDVIIISTVRCNGSGSVGFLSSHQRTNVALTRARYSLLILGNGSTLINSGSIWKNLVVDAKDRGCFFNASEDKNLAQAVLGAFIELRQYDSIFNMDSFLFTDAKWQVKFSDMFLDKIGRFFNPEICKEVAFLLVKLSSGWRQPQKDGNTMVNIEGAWPLLVKYNVTRNLRLIWAVDIVVQNSRYIQVLKIWDILPAVKIEKLAKILMQKVYGNYTETMISRCKEECFDGNLTLPITWPLDSETDLSWNLANQLAALSLRDQCASSSSSRTRSGCGFGDTKSTNYCYSKSHGRRSRRESEWPCIWFFLVKFSDKFLDAIKIFTNQEIHKKVVSLLVKLSSGWCQPQKDMITQMEHVH